MRRRSRVRPKRKGNLTPSSNSRRTKQLKHRQLWTRPASHLPPKLPSPPRATSLLPQPRSSLSRRQKLPRRRRAQPPEKMREKNPSPNRLPREPGSARRTCQKRTPLPSGQPPRAPRCPLRRRLPQQLRRRRLRPPQRRRRWRPRRPRIYLLKRGLLLRRRRLHPLPLRQTRLLRVPSPRPRRRLRRRMPHQLQRQPRPGRAPRPLLQRRL
mmetsp:Transcript_12841/g.31312  ORF Transcript_12841/g.31312 Transcript_12841/m.31312 type:complete len:211 (+) Transcript_12841:817-1449(+)